MNKRYTAIAEEIIEVLESSGHVDEGSELRQLIKRLESSSGEGRQKISEDIKSRCHPKWLGDLAIKGKSWGEWWGLLSQLARSV